MQKPVRDDQVSHPVIEKAQAMARSMGCAFYVTFKSANSMLRSKGAMFAFASLLVIPLSMLLLGLNTNNNLAQATSTTLNFQGRLLTNTGGLVADGTYNVEFNLYNVASGGTTLWTEDRLVTNTQGVTVRNGYFSVYLGEYDSLAGVNWNQNLWLGMTVRGTGNCAWGSCTPTDSEMTPRFALSAVPYAYQSANVASANTTTATTNSNNVSITTGNATGSGSNSGNITIDTGTATGTTGTISLGASNASALTLGRAGLTTSNAGALTVTQLTTLNGNLTIEAGDTFTFNGDAFTDLTGNGLQVSSNALALLIQANKGLEVDINGVSLIDCTTNQILKYNGSNQWACAADATGGGGTLQQAYDASTNPEIVVDGTRGALTVRDNATPIGANLLEVQDNGGTITYLSVDTGGIKVGGTNPTVTIGDADAEDTAIIFDGNAQDYYIALDDSVDDLIIGTGSIVGSNAILTYTGTNFISPSYWQIGNNATNYGNGFGLAVDHISSISCLIGCVGSYSKVTVNNNNSIGGSEDMGTSAIFGRVALGASAGTVLNVHGLYLQNPTVSGGAITNNYGIYVDNMISGSNDYGIYVEDAQNYSLYLASTDGDAASGITYGADTNLYRSAANVLRTDDSFSLGVLGSADTDIIVCRNSSNILSSCNSTFLTSANAFIQNGNDFGANAVLGTNGIGQTLVLETANTTRFTLSATASTLTGNGATSILGGTTLNLGSTGANAVTLATNGTTRFTVATAASTLTGNGATSILGGTTLNLGSTGANAVTLATNGTTRFTLATGASTLTGNGATSLIGGTTLDLSSAAGSALNITSGTTGAVTLDSGTTGTVNVGTGANAKTVNIGTGAAVANNINIGGTGANVIAIGDTQTAGSISLGAALTTGSINIGGTGAQTGTINVGVGTGAQALNFGTGGTGAKTVVIGSTASTGSTTIQSGSNGINLTNTTTVANTSTVAFRLQSTGGAETVLVANTGTRSSGTAGNELKVGNSTGTDTALTLFVVDTATADPTTNGGAISNGSIYYNSTTNKFRCYQNGAWTDCIGSGGGSGVDTLAAIGSTPNANGATISGTTLTLQPADGSFGGVVTTSAQTFAGVKTFNNGIVLAANQTLRVTGGATGSRPAGAEGEIYFDTTTNTLLKYSETYAGSGVYKWKADRGEYILVAANNSSQELKDVADYVADGTSDEDEINLALTDANPAGSLRKSGKVLLLAGTYVADGTILIPSDTSLEGVGAGTVIQSAADGGTPNNFNIIENSDTTNGNHDIIIRNLRIDGNTDNISASVRNSIHLVKVGGGVTEPQITGVTIENLLITEAEDHGIYFDTVVNSNIINNSIIDSDSRHIYLINSSHRNTISNNKMLEGIIGLELDSSNDNVISDNIIQNNTGDGIRLYNGTSGTVVDSNRIVNNGSEGIIMRGAAAGKNNTISNNYIAGSTSEAIDLATGDNNLIIGNHLYDNDDDTSTGSIALDGGTDNNQIIGNFIEDISDGSYAISIDNANVDNTYIADNTMIGTNGINDTGTGTILAGQSTGAAGVNIVFRQANSTTAFAVQNASGTSVLNVNTSTAGVAVTGTFSSSSTLTVSAGGASITGGLTVTTGSTFTNASSSLFTAIAISDVAAGGNIGTAATTVDVATTFNVNQTTASQTLTLPSPTVTTSGRIAYINNVGTTSFTMYSQTIASGDSASFIWNGTAWRPAYIPGSGGGGANVNLSNIASTNLSAALNVTSGNLNLTTTTSGNIVLNSAGTIELQDNTNITGTLGLQSTSTTAALFQSAAGAETVLTVNTGTRSSGTAGNQLMVGNSTGTDTALTLFVVDTASADPTTNGGAISNGSIFYNSTSNKFRCYENSTWKDCIAAGGGGGTLQNAYDASSNPELTLDATRGGLTIRDNSTPLGTNLLEIQNNAGSATYLGVSASTVTVQDSGGNNALLFDSTTSELRVYENVASPTRYLRMYYDTTNNAAVYAASSGTTQIGSGSGGGDINFILNGAQTDKLTGTKTFTSTSNYSGTDYSYVRNLTGTTYSLTGSVFKIEDLSTITSGSSSPNVLYINQNNTSATGNLILAQTGGATNVFSVSTAGVVTLRSGGSLLGAGSLTVDSGSLSTLNIGTTNANAIVVGGNTAATMTLKVANSSTTAFTLQTAGGTNLVVADTTNNRISIGVSDTTGTLLVLDTKTDTGDPTGVNGAMYYNSNANRFRCYQNGAWTNCIGANVKSGTATGVTEGTPVTVNFTTAFASAPFCNVTVDLSGSGSATKGYAWLTGAPGTGSFQADWTKDSGGGSQTENLNWICTTAGNP